MANLEKLLVEKLNHIIEANLDNPNLSTDNICHELGISRTKLYRIVKHEAQVSITIYIRKRKLDKAKTLLSTTDMRISEIADAVGINSPQNFSKYFVEEFNFSPSEFRKLPQITETPVISTNDYSIAVLPFVNRSNDIEQEYFSDGITEEIINVLSQVPALKVVGRTSSFAFKGKNEDIRTIGSLLGVCYLLEGSVRKSENKLRITAQLVKVADGYHVWSEKYDRELADIFDIQDNIALAILQVIKIKLLSKDKESTLKRYTNNTEAYQLYLNGRYYYNKFDKAEEYLKAIAYFEAAIEIESNYAMAYSGIASCYLNLWFYRYLKPDECLTAMKFATNKAMQIDNEIPESYIAQARLQLFFEWDFKEANFSFKKALELGGNSAELHNQYALLCGFKGDHHLALEHTKLALLIDPFSLFNNFYSAYIFWLAGNFEEALKQGKIMIDLEPDFWGGHFIMGVNLLQLKKYTEALTALQLAIKYNQSGLTLSACGVFYGLTDQQDKAREILTKMENLSTNSPVSNYDIGIVYACLGEIETSCKYFEIAIENHEPSMLFFKFIVRDWLSDSLHDARYLSLIDKIA
jgi:adenylate cyclase